jgi:hypothetical protein
MPFAGNDEFSCWVNNDVQRTGLKNPDSPYQRIRVFICGVIRVFRKPGFLNKNERDIRMIKSNIGVIHPGMMGICEYGFLLEKL